MFKSAAKQNFSIDTAYPAEYTDIRFPRNYPVRANSHRMVSQQSFAWNPVGPWSPGTQMRLCGVGVAIGALAARLGLSPSFECEWTRVDFSCTDRFIRRCTWCLFAVVTAAASILAVSFSLLLLTETPDVPEPAEHGAGALRGWSGAPSPCEGAAE